MGHTAGHLMRRLLAVGLLAIGGGVSAPAWAGTQACIDNSVIRCFDGCTDPNNFSECYIGCATGANDNPQNCHDQCIDDQTCLTRCLQSVADIRSCKLPSPKLTLAVGTPAYNRNTRVWQQWVRVTNNTQSEPVGNIAVVLDGPPNGWNLANSTAAGGLLGDGGPYLDLTGVLLQPGASMLVQLVYSRTGTLPLGLVPRGFSSLLR